MKKVRIVMKERMRSFRVKDSENKVYTETSK